VRSIVLPGQVWSSWSLHPPVIALLALGALAYAVGARRSKTEGPDGHFRRRHAAAFYGGLAALAIALLSPLDRVAGTIFSGHMIQHLVLISVAAPLLVYGRPGIPLLLALPESLRQSLSAAAVRLAWAKRITSLLLNAVLVAGLHAIVLWIWHLPALYQAALIHDELHIAEHLSFIATAVLLWKLIIGSGEKRRLGYAPAVLLVFVTSLQSGALGAILTFAMSELYPIHRGGAAAWGLTPLEDQQLAGGIMWIPQGMLYLAAMAILLWKAFGEVEARVLREEAADQSRAALGLGGQP
jgi:putative membrane protein